MGGALALVVAFAVALLATPCAAAVARRLHVLDRPGALKVQDRPVPYLGGTAVFVAVGVVLVPTRPSWLVPLALALALGVWDDVGEIHPVLRLACECVIGLVAGAFVPATSTAGVVVTAVFVVALINAVNLLDGLDGLAAGVVGVSAVGFAIVGGPGRVFALGLAGALAGFLVFNRPPARIYLGDGGAYLLGASLALLAASAVHSGDGVGGWAAVALLVAVPLADTGIAILRRLRAHRPLFSGDRSHVYDQLVDRGRSRGEAVLLCIVAQGVVAAIGILAWHLAPIAALVVAAGVGGATLVAAFAFGFTSSTGAT